MVSIKWLAINSNRKNRHWPRAQEQNHNRLCRRWRGTVSITGSLLAFRLLRAFSDKQKHFLCDSRAHNCELGATICDSRRKRLNWIIHFPYVCCWMIELVSEWASERARVCVLFWFWLWCKWKWMRLCASQPHRTSEPKQNIAKQCVFTAPTN